MKKWLLSFIFLSCTDTAITGTHSTVSVKFSPHGGVTKSITEEIQSSQSEIKLLAFSFTSVPIADALINAHTRKVDVQVILDRENLGNKNSMIHTLHRAQIPIFIDDKHAIQHNKVIALDNKKVITGSFNFTVSAEERNAENSLLITDSQVAQLYRDNWLLHKEHSYLYQKE